MKLQKTLVILFIITTSAVHAGPYQEGIASWYGGDFHGQLTANGEVFNTYEISAAHQDLPFGTIVRVTNTTNELTVDVRINDRGPFMKGRIIDLSFAAAQEIDMVKPGTAPVTLEILYTPRIPEDLYHRIPDVEKYRIQVAAFSSLERADQVMLMLIGKGFPAHTVHGDDGLYRIILKHIERDLLEEQISRLEEMGFTSVLVRGQE